jgi:hypothetical protein
MNYSFDDTILVWTDDISLLEITRRIANKLKLNVFVPAIDIDVVAVPHFFAIMDGEKLSEELMNMMEEVIIYEDPEQFSVLLTRLPNTEIPGSIKKYFQVSSE